MLKMIIADDEEIVRDGLKNIIPWQEFGIEIIGDASDGEEAYELCRELKPDILFTDIRMPLLDGLEVAMKIKEEKIDIKIIIISGIQDFNYAKTALDLNAEGYILKPVKLTELREVIARVVNNINMKRNMENEMLLLKKQLAENLPSIREGFLRDLILGTFYDDQDIVKKLAYLDIPFKMDENIIAAVLQIDDYRDAVKSFDEERKQLLNLLVQDVSGKILSNYSSGMCIHTGDNEFVIILSQAVQAGKRYIGICEEIMSCVSELTDVTVSIGLGRPAHGIPEIGRSYREALDAVKYKFYTGSNSLLYIDDFVENMNDISFLYIFEMEKQLMDCIKLGDCSKVAKILDEMFNLFYTNKKVHSSYLKSVCIEIISVSSRITYEFNEDIEKIIANHSQIIDDIMQKDNVLELKKYMLSVLLTVTNHFAGKYKKKSEENINKIKEIINKRYMEDISISGISEEVYLTPNYISLIFKRETNMTITEYITEIRMKKAKDMLMTTDLKVQEIAEMVGYENPHYFSTVFKKQTGVHPMKYRSLAGN